MRGSEQAGAVRVMVGIRPIDASALHRQTGGNPFFVTEVLSNTGAGLPLTIRDAVLGRVARLSQPAQTVLEAAAVVGPRIEPWLLARMVAAEVHAADECLAGGVLITQGNVLAFRHELARQTVLEAIPAARRARLHRLALDGLRTAPSEGADLTRLTHHAEGAVAAGAHRAAAALFGAHASECLHIADNSLTGARCRYAPAATATLERARSRWVLAELSWQRASRARTT